MIKLAPSLLAADLSRLADKISLVAEVADYIHCDVMDGHFVPNLTFGAPVIKAIKRVSPLPLDVHLMIEKPFNWINSYVEAGLDGNDYLTIHWEADRKTLNTVRQIRESGVRAGVAVKPKTPFAAIKPLLDRIDQVLIMTVEPGFSGQSFIESVVPKIRQVREHAPEDLVIGVDGGITLETIELAAGAGADLIVAGNAIYAQSDPVAAAVALREQAQRARQG